METKILALFLLLVKTNKANKQKNLAPIPFIGLHGEGEVPADMGMKDLWFPCFKARGQLDPDR